MATLCSIQNCSKQKYATELCNGHYLRKRKGRPMEPPIANRYPGQVCKIEGCETFTAKNGGYGYCRNHYGQWSRHKRLVELTQLLGGKCADCHKKYPLEVYDFHHREPKKKTFTIGAEICNFSLDKVIREVRKCDLLCANCHRRRHANGLF